MDLPFLMLLEMDMKGWALASRRERTAKLEAHFAVHPKSSQFQTLPSVVVFDHQGRCVGASPEPVNDNGTLYGIN